MKNKIHCTPDQLIKLMKLLKKALAGSIEPREFIQKCFFVEFNIPTTLPTPKD
jgi:hypothetical protein